MLNIKLNKKTIALLACMIAVIVLTILFTSTWATCDICEKKFTGTIYFALDDSPLCKTCGEEYYSTWSGDYSEYIGKLEPSGMRSVVLPIIEFIVFAVVIYHVNKKSTNGMKIKEVLQVVKNKILAAKETMFSNSSSSVAQNHTVAPPKEEKNKAESLRELKALLDEGILTQEEFEAEKKLILRRE